MKYSKIGALAGIALLALSCGESQQTKEKDSTAQVVMASPYNVAIINRSLPLAAESDQKPISEMLHEEHVYLDKHGSIAAIESLKAELSEDSNLKEIKLVDAHADHKIGSHEWPEELSWEAIEDICKTNNVNKVYSLAYFHTDSKLNIDEVGADQTELLVNTKLTIGWRIYDNATKTIQDQHSYTGRVVSRGKGVNEATAMNSITNRKQTIIEMSNNFGFHFAQRQMPNTTEIAVVAPEDKDIEDKINSKF